MVWLQSIQVPIRPVAGSLVSDNFCVHKAAEVHQRSKLALGGDGLCVTHKDLTKIQVGQGPTGATVGGISFVKVMTPFIRLDVQSPDVRRNFRRRKQLLLIRLVALLMDETW